MRHSFGGSPADYAMERVGSQLLLRPNSTGTVWDAVSGGTQYTDLTTPTGSPITSVTADADGAVSFMGPDGVTSLFVDFGYGRRYAMTATDLGDVLTDFIASGGEAGGYAVLDGSGNIDPSQIPAQLDWLNVTTYGALGDGAHDDTINIQNAINACAPGGIVYFPRGVYKTTATLDLKNGVTLKGSHTNLMVGPGMTGADYPCYIQPAAPFTGTSVVQIIGENDGTHPDISGEQRFIDLMLDGSQLTGSSIDGVYAKGNVQNVVMENFTVRQMPNNGIVTASRGDGKLPFSWRLRHVMVDQCHANGILMTGNTDLTLDDVQVIGCWAQGIVLTNSTNSQITGCRAEWNGSHGIHITGAWGDWAGSGGMLLGDCTTDRNGQHGVLIDATGNTPISISNLSTRRDGRNGGTGGGQYAGLAIIGATVPVIADVVTCYPGVDDGGASTNSPQFGARFSGSTTVVLDNAILHGATAGLRDDGTNGAVSLGDSIITTMGATTATARRIRPRPGGELGIYVPAGWGKFWRAKRDAAGTSLAKIVTLGGSATQGFYASNPRTKSWPGQLATTLQGIYGDGGSGLHQSSLSSTVLAAGDAAALAAWTTAGAIVTQTGTWTQGGSKYGPGANYLYSDVTGNTLTFKARGTTVKIYTVTGSGTRPAMLYSIDGAADVSVAQPGGTAAIQTTTITGLTNVEHTVRVKVGTASAGQYLSVCGVSGENATGVLVHNCALAGARSSTYGDPTTAGLNAVWNGGVSFPGDLVIYTAGPNDAAANTTGEDWAANVAKWLKAVKDTGSAVGDCDIILALPHLGTHDTTNYKYQDYAIRGRGLAEAYGAAFVDWWAIGRNSWQYWNSLGYWGTSAGTGAAGTDGVHLSDNGFAAMSNALLPLVLT